MKTELMELIQKAFPQAVIDVSDETSKGFWINIDHAGKKAAVEYHEEKGFGVSDMNGMVGYGEGHDMTTECIEDIVGFITTIFGRIKPA